MNEKANDTAPVEGGSASERHPWREAWHKTVGAFATDERGTTSLVNRLVDFGQLSKEEARRVLADARTKIDANRKELDARVDDSLKKLQARFDPFAEAHRLEGRIGELEARLRELEAEVLR